MTSLHWQRRHNDIRRSRAAGSRAVARRSRLICSSARLFSASSLPPTVGSLPSAPDFCSWLRRAARRAASSGSAMGVRGTVTRDNGGCDRAWERKRCTSLSRRFAFVVPPRSSTHTMSSVKHHPSLPAPVVSAGANLQAKSSVLTGVQDAYWSDEEVRRLFFSPLAYMP